MSAERELVFVYGTLRRGGSNHWRMDGSRHVASGAVRARLYRIDWFPGLILDDAADSVAGEVYEVTPQHLAELDVFEGVAAEESRQSEYRRVKATVRHDGGHDSPLSAWVWEWLGPVDEASRIPHGDWLQAFGGD